MKKKLLVLGESYMNLQMHTNPVTKDEKTTYGDTYSFHPYGVGATTAISAAKLGADCTFCTKLGDDQNGERLKKYYKSCGIDTSFVRRIFLFRKAQIHQKISEKMKQIHQRK